MKRKILLTMAMVALVVVFVALNVRVGYAAPRLTGYEISWYSIDGGGAMNLTGGTYSLSGTIGQFDAGMQNGGTYMLNGGYWVDVFGYRLYLPIILK